MIKTIHNTRQTVDLRKNPQRQTQSKAKIQAALQDLLNQKTFDQISVSGICQRAGINRGTFYLHYLDKFDLVDQLAHDLKEEVFAILEQRQEPTNNKSHLLASLDHLKAHYQLIQSLVKVPQLNFLEQVQLFMEKIWQEHPDFGNRIVQQPQFKPDYARAVLISSIHAILEHWILTDCQDDSQDIADMLWSIRLIYTT